METNALKMPGSNPNFTTFSGNRLPFKCPYWRAKTGGVKQSSEATASVIALAMKKVAGNRSKLARVWREIQGINNWENLVEPLDSLLREEIIRYGEFVASCYRAFDLDPGSKRYWNCKYGKSRLLDAVGLGGSGYRVTKYIYATPDINISIPIQSGPCCGRWIGYVAISDDDESEKLGRRDVMVAFRGTVTNLEWLANFNSTLVPACLDPLNPRPEVKVEAGFLSLYTSNESAPKFGLPSCREQLLSEISRLLNLYQQEEMSITFAGHSMGSSLAILLAYDIAELGFIETGGVPVPVTVFSFGGPRVGSSGFKQRCEELGIKVLRIVNAKDPITKMPGVFFNEGFRVFAERYDLPWSRSCYAHVGVELLLDFFKMHPSYVHDLENYIELLKCPLNDLEIIQREEFSFLRRAIEAALSGARNLKGLHWRIPNVAFNIEILHPTCLYNFLSRILIF